MNILTLPKSFGFGNFRITFYALCILTGACLALFVSSLRVKKRGYNPKDIENLFLVAFPLGLVGARVWYCAWQWYEFWPEGTSFWSGLAACFGFVDGSFQGLSGLAIQGGLLLGVLAGLIFLKKRRPHMVVLEVVDACVPTVLIGQAVGRWGNFFNQEVYGKAVDSSAWQWLGQWFVDQMTISGQFRLPLFLIEGTINIIGFFILVFVVDKLTKKVQVPGTILGSYFIWYGTVRMILEPLRDPAYIMTTNGTFSTSRFTAIMFIIIGALFIVALYVNQYVLKPKHKDFTTGLRAFAPWFRGLSRSTRIILEAIPVTGWFNAFVYRFSMDNFTAAIFAVIFGPVFWIIDLVTTLKDDKITLWAEGQRKAPAPRKLVKEHPEAETKDSSEQ